ncbi:response regulator [Nocardioides panacisoli]|uniref:response regulator n=1 Tax=Nocardioides panacisoli TaxID=627624 RepID=UPI001C63A4C5|nr:response regulator [Nocardioides panacisoli]QYJ04280.1 response regulator [Nocardioides panacisoli]
MIGVLVVDDDFMVARIHARFVEQTPGFAVAGVAHSGAEALAQVATVDPDLILLDVHLPDVSGLEVLERIRGEGRQVAVVMVTAERGADAVRAALHGGAMQYLVKPFEYDDLADRLRRVAAAVAQLSDEAGDATPVDQATIDTVFGGPSRARPRPRLPKGLSPETAALVLDAVRRHEETSASEAGEAVGLSRVTARRYLEHFADTGAVEVRLRYGTSGRPERRYRLP